MVGGIGIFGKCVFRESHFQVRDECFTSSISRWDQCSSQKGCGSVVPERRSVILPDGVDSSFIDMLGESIELDRETGHRFFDQSRHFLRPHSDIIAFGIKEQSGKPVQYFSDVHSIIDIPYRLISRTISYRWQRRERLLEYNSIIACD